MSDSDLIDYVLGHLDAAAHARVEASLRESETARAQLAELREIFGRVGASAAPAHGSSALDARIAAMGVTASRYQGFAERLATLFDIASDEAAALLREAAGTPQSDWQPAGLPGVFQRSLPDDASGPQRAIVYLEPGANVPRHRHRGSEQMLIIDGFARESGGREVAPGDRVDSAPGSAHDFQILADMPCVFAVSLDGKVEFET